MSTQQNGARNGTTEPLQSGRLRQESLLLTPDGGRHWSGWLAAVMVVGAFTLVGGLAGAVAGIITAVVWALTGTPYALVTGTVFLTALTPDGSDPLTVGVAGTALLVLVFAPAVTATAPGSYVVAVILPTAVLGGLVWLFVPAQPLWVGAVVVLGTGAVIVYGLHRYLHLRLGLLDADDSPAKNAETAEPTESTETTDVEDQ